MQIFLLNIISDLSQSLLFTCFCIFIHLFFPFWPSLKHKCWLRRDAVLSWFSDSWLISGLIRLIRGHRASYSCSKMVLDSRLISLTHLFLQLDVLSGRLFASRLVSHKYKTGFYSHFQHIAKPYAAHLSYMTGGEGDRGWCWMNPTFPSLLIFIPKALLPGFCSRCCGYNYSCRCCSCWPRCRCCRDWKKKMLRGKREDDR